MGSIPLALLAGLVAVDRIIAAADRTPDRPGSQYQAQATAGNFCAMGETNIL